LTAGRALPEVLQATTQQSEHRQAGTVPDVYERDGGQTEVRPVQLVRGFALEFFSMRGRNLLPRDLKDRTAHASKLDTAL